MNRVRLIEADTAEEYERQLSALFEQGYLPAGELKIVTIKERVLISGGGDGGPLRYGTVDKPRYVREMAPASTVGAGEAMTDSEISNLERKVVEAAVAQRADLKAADSVSISSEGYLDEVLTHRKAYLAATIELQSAVDALIAAREEAEKVKTS